MNDIEFLETKLNLINEGLELCKNATWDNWVETHLKIIQWKLKVRRFLDAK